MKCAMLPISKLLLITKFAIKLYSKSSVLYMYCLHGARHKQKNMFDFYSLTVSSHGVLQNIVL